MGILLIALGVIGAIWIAYCVLGLFQLAGDDPANVPIIGTILKYYETDNTIRLSNGVVELPKVFYFVIGFSLYFFALRIMEGLTRTLLTTGANLLENELNTIAAKFKKELNNLKGIISRNR